MIMHYYTSIFTYTCCILNLLHVFALRNNYWLSHYVHMQLQVLLEIDAKTITALDHK